MARYIWYVTTADEVLQGLLVRLRQAGGDTDDIEVKSAAGGLSASLTSSLCALSNLPGGGWVLLGLDERTGFSPVGLSDVTALKQGLAAKARSCAPPVQLEFSDAELDGMPVVIAKVAATAASAKPCRVRSTGRAWTRSWDGDVEMSALEEQALLALREQPVFDERPAPNSRPDDLDPDRLRAWSATVAELDSGGLGRFSGEELLRRAGVLTDDGVPSVAGLLTLGKQPQQRIARYVINLSVERGVNGAVRATEATTLTGPIPLMLEQALAWARKAFVRRTVVSDDGSVRERWEYPLEAFRELIANALVHRDLDEWSRGEAIEVRLENGALRVTNPGGLYGITVDRLGVRGTTSARNGRLLEICRYARTSDDARVVETLASGIPRILELLQDGGQPPPEFYDNGLRFTVILRERARQDPVDAFAALGDSQRKLFTALVAGPMTIDELVTRTGLTAPTARKALRALAKRGLTGQHGGRGRTTRYFRMET